MKAILKKLGSVFMAAAVMLQASVLQIPAYAEDTGNTLNVTANYTCTLPEDETVTYDSITIANGMTFTVSGKGILTVSGNIEGGNIVISGGATVYAEKIISETGTDSTTKDGAVVKATYGGAITVSEYSTVYADLISGDSGLNNSSIGSANGGGISITNSEIYGSVTTGNAKGTSSSFARLDKTYSTGYGGNLIVKYSKIYGDIVTGNGGDDGRDYSGSTHFFTGDGGYVDLYDSVVYGSITTGYSPKGYSLSHSGHGGDLIIKESVIVGDSIAIGNGAGGIDATNGRNGQLITEGNSSESSWVCVGSLDEPTSYFKYGVLIVGESGKAYNTCVIENTNNVALPVTDIATLTIDKTITNNAKITNNGTIKLTKDGKINGFGTISGNGSFIAEARQSLFHVYDIGYTGEELAPVPYFTTEIQGAEFTLENPEQWEVSYSPAEVKEVGEYTATFTYGEESYSTTFEVLAAGALGTAVTEGTPVAKAVYGTKLSDITIEGITVKFGDDVIDGTWAFEGDDILPAGNTTAYTAVFTPDTDIPEITMPTLDIVPEISKRTIKIAAINESVIYGNTPALKYQVLNPADMLDSDILSGALSASDTIGDNTIEQGTLTTVNSNYQIEFYPAILTVISMSNPIADYTEEQEFDIGKCDIEAPAFTNALGEDISGELVFTIGDDYCTEGILEMLLNTYAAGEYNIGFRFTPDDATYNKATGNITVIINEAVVDITVKGLEITAGDGKITLTWNAVDGATKYKVRRHNGTAWTDYKTIAATTLTDTDVVNGTTYKYAVYAYANGKWSGASAIVSAKPVAAITTSTVPTGVKATATDSEITLTWNEVDGATKYKVRRHDGTAWADYEIVTDTSLVDTEVTSGTTYKYAVYAYANGKWSGASTVVSVSPKAAAPANVNATASDGVITLTWDEVNGATKYKVRRHDGTAWADYKTVTDTTLVDTEVTSDTTYKYAVYAYAGGKWSGASAIVSATA